MCSSDLSGRKTRRRCECRVTVPRRETSDNKIGKRARGREFDLLMFRFLAAKASTRLFDDPAIEAQATRGKEMMTVNQIGMQAFNVARDDDTE